MRKDAWIQTFSGKQFWPLAPRAEEVDIIDIAHALSMTCRYNGHTSRFYSVAEHCWRLSFVVPQEVRLEALLHDAAEAYICDVPRPIKPYLTGYKEIEERIEQAVAQAFGLTYPWPDAVKEADTRILSNEQAALMWPPAAPWRLPFPPFPDVDLTKSVEVTPTMAKRLFVFRFIQLRDERKEVV